METNESRIRYLEAIQRVIDRLSNTSFILKGWAVSLVAGLTALAASGANQGYVLVAYIPIVVFWLLDAYFLMMERQYRKLFEENMDLSLEVRYFALKRKKSHSRHVRRSGIIHHDATHLRSAHWSNTYRNVYFRRIIYGPQNIRIVQVC